LCCVQYFRYFIDWLLGECLGKLMRRIYLLLFLISWGVLGGCAQSLNIDSNTSYPSARSAVTAPAKSTVAHSSKELKLKQNDGWRLSLTLVHEADGSIRPGNHEFSQLNCGGTYGFERRDNDGRIVLRQKITYGRCVQNCQLILAKDFSSYREVCSGRDTGGGVFANVVPTDREVSATSEKSVADGRGIPSVLSASARSLASPGVFVASNQVVWRRCDIGRIYDVKKNKCVGSSLKFNWIDAVAAVNNLNSMNFEGYSNWRLPDSADLKAFVLFDKFIKMNAGVFSSGGGDRKTREMVCKIANSLIHENFGKYADEYFGFYESQHWLTDNSSDSWQDAVSFNFTPSFGMMLHGYCNIAFIALARNKPNEMRVHAEIPIVVVRGGRSEMWESAQAALSNRSSILAGSEKAGANSLKFYNDVIDGVVKWVRDNAQSASSASSRAVSLSSAKFVCRVKCTGSMWAQGEGLSVEVSAGNSESAASEASRLSVETCRGQANSRGSSLGNGLGLTPTVFASDCISKLALSLATHLR